MHIELRNIKTADFASRETVCFTATVYIDGKRASVVENDGQGGPNLWHDRDAEERVDAYARTLPPIEAHGYTLPMNAELLIGNLLTDARRAKELKQALAKRVLFVRDGQIYETKPMSADALRLILARADLASKLNATAVLNLLPFDAALKLYAQ